MKTKLLSALLTGTILLGSFGELGTAAFAVETAPAVQTDASVESIAIHPDTLWLRADEQELLTAAILPETTQAVTWSSSDTNVCTVDSTGTLTAIHNGTAVITVQAGSMSVSCTVHVGIAAPEALTASTTSDGTVLSWNAVDGCDGYRISRRASAEGEWEDIATLSDTEWTDTSGLDAVEYVVRAYKLRNSQTDAPETLWSDYTSAQAPVPQASEKAAPAKPDAPVLVSAEAPASGGVCITWEAVPNADGYYIYRKSGDNWNKLHIIRNASTCTYTDTRTAPSTAYTYTVRAYTRSRGIVLSDYDDTGVTATTSTAKPAPDPAPTTAISAPQLGTVTSGGYNKLTVTWKTADKAEGYNIYRKTSASADWKLLKTVSGGKTTSYTDSSVSCGVTYYYTVSAYQTVDGKKVSSSYSSTGISGKAVPATPALKSAESASATSIKLTWGSVSGATGYHVYRRTSTNADWKYLTTLVGAKYSYTDTGLTKGQRYYYTVAAYYKMSDGTNCIGGRNNTGISAIPTAAPYTNVYATYTTNYSASNVNRTTNLNIACKTINGTVVKPGETFSFNSTLGERTAGKGYKPATIFTGGTGTAQELGGGICQVASTMFNTALLANVTITQRYPHSQKVSYCPVGRDAGIYYGSKDFKFTNNTKYNIKIKAWISGGNLTVQFLTTEAVKPPAVKLTVTRSGSTYTLKRSVNGTVNYTTKSTY
ncbi:MAG: VanW family protein [Eubacteriales bacterium]|nr:VanW family protein [Eubacteriales bacterium]